MEPLDHSEGAYRTPDQDRAHEQQLLAAFDAEIARQRARDRQRVRRARTVGLIVSGLCAALFTIAMAGNLVKEGVTANGLKPLLTCAAVVLALAVLVWRARVILRQRRDLSRQKLDTDIVERIAAEISAAQQQVAEPPLEPAPAESDRNLSKAN